MAEVWLGLNNDVQSRQRYALVLLAFGALGCGAKTGLLFEERARDAESDAPMDAGVDGNAPPPMPEICIELPPEEPPRFVDTSFVARIATADVLFLVDVTGSMTQEIDQIRDTLRDEIAPALISTIPDVQLAVAEFADFPVFPYGDPRDLPFRLLQPSTSDLSAAQQAVERLPERSGSDVPESHVQALWHVATGAGAGTFVDPARCPPDTVGYPCFRSRGSRIVLLFTDAEFHNGPANVFPYSDPPITPPPVAYDDAVAAMRGIGAKVLGLFSGDFGASTAEDHLLRIARDTGAVDQGGAPVFFNIGTSGERLDAGVIEVVRRLVDEVPLDIDVLLEDFADDELDALSFVTSVETRGAAPMDGAQDLGDRYEDVRPGTSVSFRVNLANERFPRRSEPQRYLMTIVLRGDGVTRLRQTVVEIVIPSIDGVGCEQPDP